MKAFLVVVCLVAVITYQTFSKFSFVSTTMQFAAYVFVFATITYKIASLVYNKFWRQMLPNSFYNDKFVLITGEWIHYWSLN